MDFSRNRVYVVNPKWKGDKRKTEGNPMSKEVRELLEQLCRDAKGEQLCTDEHGQRLKRHIVDCAFRRACARAEIVDLRFHDLRHEYGSRLGDADVNLKKIARLWAIRTRSRRSDTFTRTMMGFWPQQKSRRRINVPESFPKEL